MVFSLTANTLKTTKRGHDFFHKKCKSLFLRKHLGNSCDLARTLTKIAFFKCVLFNLNIYIPLLFALFSDTFSTRAKTKTTGVLTLNFFNVVFVMCAESTKNFGEISLFFTTKMFFSGKMYFFE